MLPWSLAVDTLPFGVVLLRSSPSVRQEGRIATCSGTLHLNVLFLSLF